MAETPMDFDSMFRTQLETLKSEGNYRTFAELERSGPLEMPPNPSAMSAYMRRRPGAIGPADSSPQRPNGWLRRLRACAGEGSGNGQAAPLCPSRVSQPTPMRPTPNHGSGQTIGSSRGPAPRRIRCCVTVSFETSTDHTDRMSSLALGVFRALWPDAPRIRQNHQSDSGSRRPLQSLPRLGGPRKTPQCICKHSRCAGSVLP